MPPDRLAELQRQRELVRAHLAWLDQEIAAAIGRSNASTPRPSPAAPLVEAVHISETPPPDPAVAANQARRGCLIAGILVFVLGTLILIAIYYFGYRDRPLV